VPLLEGIFFVSHYMFWPNWLLFTHFTLEPYPYGKSYILTIVFRYVVPKPRNECSKSEQLVVTFAAGYIAGVFCAIVSHPADTVVSKLNQEKGSTALEAAKKLGFAGKMTVYI
jgi:solute carrier family 25 phosphate transporter 3